MTTQSFIDAVLTNMSSSKTQFGKIAALVQKKPHSSACNRIAMAYVQLQNDRAQARTAGNVIAMAGIDSGERADAGLARNPVIIKPELLFNFLQNVQNSICWSARRLMRQQETVEAGEQANGLDFSQDLAEQLGVEGTPTDKLGEIVANDLFVLGNLQSWLLTKMNYLTEVEELRMFADFRPPEEGLEVGTGNWELRHEAATWEEALSIMDVLVDELNVAENLKTGAEASSIDFGDSGAVAAG